MKIYYFSGTGNSLYVAREIAKAFEGAELVPILSVLKYGKTDVDADCAGFVFPIHMNAMPWPVKEFVEKCGLDRCGEIFAVATHGGLSGKTEAFVREVFAKKGHSLWFYEDIKMINNTPKGVAPKPLMTLDWEKGITEDKIREIEARTKERVAGIVERIKKKQPKEAAAKAGVLTRLLWKVSEASRPKLEFLLSDSCTGCGICDRVCLSNRVRMENGKPIWPKASPCYYCYACFNFCPVQAIGVKHYTKKEGRYHYPGISAEDIASQKD